MDKTEHADDTYEIKLIKYGILFFYDPATLKYDSSKIEITKANGEIVFTHAPNNLKRVNFNSRSGIFTLKTYTGQKVNIAFKGTFTLDNPETETKFRTYLKEYNIKGFTI